MDNVQTFVEEAKSSVEDSKFFIINNCYYTKRSKGEIKYDFKLTNFIVEIIASHYRTDGIYREICLISQNGIRSPHCVIAPTEMYDSFKSFLASRGNFSWFGLPYELNNFWNHLFNQDPGKIIYEPECIGWQDSGIFMFENIAFKADTEIKPDKNGTFWLTLTNGIKPRSISQGESADGLPYISTNKLLDLDLLRSKLQDSMGTTNADQALGWSASVFYMEEVFERYNCFPFLFISGKRRSGKSTIAEWITNLFGMEYSGLQWASTTQNAINRYLGYYSSLPVWLDEYRNDSKSANKTGTLRNVYNRQSAGKATREGFTVKDNQIRGTVIVSGEETPEDNALFTRCVIIRLSEKTRKVNHFNWFTDNKVLLSNFTYQILKDKPTKLKKYLEDLNANKEELSKSVDDRLAINKAVIATGFSILFGYDKSFANALVESTTQASLEAEEESSVSVFFNDVTAMLFNKSISQNYIAIKDGFIYIYFHGMYNEWAADYRRRKGSEPFKMQSIRGYLEEEPGFVEMSSSCRMQDNSIKSCVKFLIESAPEYIKQLV